VYSTPTVVGDLVYIGSCSGVLFALHRETGQLRWSHDVKPGGLPTSFHGDPLVIDSTLVIGTDGGTADSTFGEVWAFDLVTGRVRWKYSTTDGIVSDVCRAEDRLLVITRADSLLCLAAADGSPVWSFRGGEPVYPSPYRSPAVAGGHVFFGASDGQVHALDAATGLVLWTRDLRDRISTGILAADGALYVGTGEGDLHRLRQDTGAVEARAGIGYPVLGPPTPVGDSLVVLIGEHSIVCVDRALESVRWHRHLPDALSSSRPYLWQGAVLGGSVKGDLFAFRARDGRPLWSHSLPGVIRGIGVADRTLYVGTLDGRVHAYARPRRRPAGR